MARSRFGGGVEGVEICEGDSREEIAEYLKRNPGLSRVAEADGKSSASLFAVMMAGGAGFITWRWRRPIAAAKVGKLLLDDCVDGLARSRPETRHHSRGRR